MVGKKLARSMSEASIGVSAEGFYVFVCSSDVQEQRDG